jgi:Mitochondrial ribosomal death-associated protein 3
VICVSAKISLIFHHYLDKNQLLNYFYHFYKTQLISNNAFTMNQLARNSILTQRLLCMSSALKSVGRGSADNAAAMAVSLTPLLQRMHLSTEADGDGSSPVDPEALPKKRRGRPPKAKPSEQSSDEETASLTAKDVSNSTESSSADVAKEASPLPTEIEGNQEISPISRQPRPPKPQPFSQGLSTIINPLTARDPSNWHSGASVTDLNPSNSSSTPPFGFYVDIPSTALPEAEATFYHDPALTEEKVKQTHYGCKAATSEFQFSSKRVVMHRPVIADILEKALRSSTLDISKAQGSDTSNRNSINKIYIEGWTGAGKSIALYTLAATARAAGKVVMYIPTASLLTQGGRFYRREVNDGGGEGGEVESSPHSLDNNNTVWDTPEAARFILTAVLNAHSEQLASMPVPFQNKNNNKKIQTLAEVATAALASTDPTEIVEAAITIKDGILADTNGMVIVDEYNALYSHTGYHEPMHQFYRRPLAVDELRLARSFRILEEEEEGEESGENGRSYKGVAVVAPSYGGGISPALRVLHPNNSRKRANTSGTSGTGDSSSFLKKTIDVIRVPRFDLNEVSSFAAMAVGNGALINMPSEIEVRRALALTNGNGKELREMSTTLLVGEGPLGVSLGYKAFAVAKKQYNVALEL